MTQMVSSAALSAARSRVELWPPSLTPTPTHACAGDLLLVLHSHKELDLALYELQSSATPPGSQQPGQDTDIAQQTSQPRLLHIFQRPDSLFNDPQDYYLMATFAPDSKALFLHYCNRDEGLGPDRANDTLLYVELPSMQMFTVPWVVARPGVPPFILESAVFSPDNELTVLQLWSPACIGNSQLPASQTHCMHFCNLRTRSGKFVAQLYPANEYMASEEVPACDRRCLADPAFSPDGRLLAVGMGCILTVFKPPGTRPVWGLRMGRISPPTEPVQTFVFSHAGDRFAIGWGDCRAILVYDTKTWLPLTLSDSGDWLYSGRSGTLVIQQGNVHAQADPSADLVCLSELPADARHGPATALSPCGTFLAVQDSQCEHVQIFDLRSQQAVGLLSLPKLQLPEPGCYLYQCQPSLLLGWAASGLILTITRTWETTCEATELILLKATLGRLMTAYPTASTKEIAELATRRQQGSPKPSWSSASSKKACKVVQVVDFSFA